MRSIPLVRLAALAVVAALAMPGTADAQIFKKLKETVSDAAEDEVLTQVDRLVREGVACPFNDFECIESARDSGDDYYLTDEEGEVVVDEEGEAVTDPAEAAAVLGKPAPASAGAAVPPPGAGTAPPPADLSTAHSNYDFEAGDRVLVEEDFFGDNVGDFPRRFSLVEGSFEVIEWQDARYVRALSGGSFAIPLPETLPETFTLETAVNLQHGNAYLRITPGRAFHGRPRDYQGSAVSIELARAGVRPVGADGGPDARARIEPAVVQDAVVPVRVMADGDHMKVYLGDERVANVPNAVFPRSDTLFVAVSSATPERPIVIGGFRIAGGGRDLYDRLSTEGRVATRGIHFDVNSATIRPESRAALDEIGSMLREHPDLRISIEGHTDSDGDDASNLDLSERRAAAVRDYLVANYGVEGARLESVGLGETVPVADNATPEGRQENRRVELVRL